ncbi:SpoIID/LytB domain-containing protein [Ornithinibacillus sp. L9]|uniref:SpoIID/LytB domain-containing protein n=1 Tax=Ornithinibacillus caprae TaxID=2678566 RepID=A0A6N8FNN6_9BACI|nr:SpoIID/LytB domain-containing protein [Ornithinibacillus caprae]MUK89008.1 SpoIID/LytB domain-containing protein [Ornithinibacillus caprae]
MSKKLFGLLFIVLFVFSTVFSNTGVSFAEEEDTQMIRIGVVPSAEAVTVGSDGNFSITDKETKEVLYSGTSESVQVALDSVANIQTNYRLQVAWTTSNAYVEDWLNRAEIGGYATYIEPYNNGWRLLIGEFPADAGWGERETFRQEVIANGLAESDSYWRLITISTGESQLKISAENYEEIVSNPVQIESSDDLIEINGKKYRGIGEVAFNSSGTLAGINELPLEEYLYGVVPLELPPVPYGELEAQKSQAVAARTYAISGLGKRNSDGYDLLPTTSDQVYGGYEAEHSVSTQAVQETTGVVATYNDNLINAVYHSTTGGFTANNEDVWESGPVDYLRGVPDAQRGKAFENVPTLEVFKNSSNLKSLRAMRNGDFEADWSRYHRWHFEWTNEEISNVLSSYFNTDVGEVYEINVLERSDSGRVLEIEFVTENGNFYEYKDRVRWALQYINTNGTPSVLLSTLFYIEPVIDNKTKELTGFEVYGGGWGHGVGLSQTGAMGMAVKGHTYDEILKHYYQGIELEERY